FTLPTVTRLDDLGDRPRLTITAAEGSGDAIDLGWFASEPLVGQPRALAGLAAKSDSAAIVFATEQDERLRALLDEAGVKSALQGHAPDRVGWRASRMPRARVRRRRSPLRARRKPGPCAKVPRRRGCSDASPPRHFGLDARARTRAQGGPGRGRGPAEDLLHA